MKPARLISLLLILTLGLSTVGVGMARGQTPAAGQMVICTGHGIVTLSIDADGNPVRSQTLCPDAVLTLLAATPLVQAGCGPVHTSRSWRDWPDARAVPTLAPALTRGARGPPV